MYLKKPYKCVLKIVKTHKTHKPWDSFQKDFRVNANHLSCWPKWGTKVYLWRLLFPVKWMAALEQLAAYDKNFAFYNFS